MENLKKQIAVSFQLSEEETDIFLASFTKTQFRKNDVFSQEGRICDHVGLIEKGLMKCVYNKNGEEIIFEFACENNFISDYYSFVTATPSEKEIRCLEDCVVYVISKTELNKLGQQFAFIERMSRQMNEFLFLKIHNRLKSALLDSPAERYRNLVSERQDLAQRIPQYMLASYLNVKPETISRIRKRLSASHIS